LYVYSSPDSDPMSIDRKLVWINLKKYFQMTFLHFPSVGNH
jgi:hypothetical protein